MFEGLRVPGGALNSLLIAKDYFVQGVPAVHKVVAVESL